MSYTPTEWKTGDVITADKLNNMEGGIAGAGGLFVINATNPPSGQNPSTTPELDKTYSEIKTAIQQGKNTVMFLVATSGPVSNCMYLQPIRQLSGIEEAEEIRFSYTNIDYGGETHVLTNVSVTVKPSSCTAKMAQATISYG